MTKQRLWSDDGILVREVIDGIEVNENLGKTRGQLGVASFVDKAKNIAIATGQAMQNPKPVSKEERERRLSICNTCEFLIDGKRCSKCGCMVNWKSRLAAWHCPIGKW